MTIFGAGLGAELLEVEQAAEGAVVVALEAGFGVAEGLEVGPAHFGGDGGGDGSGGGVAVALDAAGEEFAFRMADAGDAPVGGDHGVDLMAFGGSEGGELGAVGVAQGVVIVLGFAGQNDGAAVETVFDGVQRRPLLTGFGLGAFRFRAVATSGFRAGGRHDGVRGGGVWLFHTLPSSW
ncbi:MAG: hypothetical protein JSU00_06615 [Acidobacteria bacterium]|nr:hypothetical protein [Acidobacteriota bacterium]